MAVDTVAERKKLFAFGEWRMGLFEKEGDREGVFNVNRLFLKVPDEEKAMARGLTMELPEEMHLDWFTSYYRQFCKRAPLLASFCLEHLLEPNAAVRAKNPEALLNLATLMRSSFEHRADASASADHGEGLVKFPQDPTIGAAIASLYRTRRQLERRRTSAA